MRNLSTLLAINFQRLSPPLLFHFYQSFSKTQYHYNFSWDHRIQEFNGKLEIFFSLKLPWFWWYPCISVFLPSLELIFLSSVQPFFSVRPQVSVAQSFMFCSLFLGDLIHSLSFSCGLYADDSQCSSAFWTTAMNSALYCPPVLYTTQVLYIHCWTSKTVLIVSNSGSQPPRWLPWSPPSWFLCPCVLLPTLDRADMRN